MTQGLKIAVICGVLVSTGIMARAQDVIADDAEAASFAAQANAGVNGVTDRYGMPIPPWFIGPPWIGARPVPNIGQGIPAAAMPGRAAPNRAKLAPKRGVAKTKDARRARNTARGASVPAPRYFLPHGSLEWSPGPRSIITSPANPYGYGYGLSGYGTEVFGDFWKGWPIVQY
jgi:hypothetical protein